MLNFKGFFLLFGVICGSASSEIVQGSCREGYRQCEIGACLLEKYVCDGIAQCPDETDEKNCTFQTLIERLFLVDREDQPATGLQQEFCEEGYVACATGSICVMTENVCDGVPHCIDNSDESHCPSTERIVAEPAIEATTSVTDMATTTLPTVSTTPSSEEDVNPNSDEKESGFRLGDDENHCAHYKRMIVLVRRAHVKLTKMDKKTARLFRHLINEILMEAGMENFASLLELYHVCNLKTTEDTNN